MRGSREELVVDETNALSFGSGEVAFQDLSHFLLPWSSPILVLNYKNVSMVGIGTSDSEVGFEALPSLRVMGFSLHPALHLLLVANSGHWQSGETPRQLPFQYAIFSLLNTVQYNRPFACDAEDTAKCP
jgi:hypothetical protein